jgi:hypothetical protein
MRGRRLLDLCLLAYPRACRERDRDYLRDLALEFAERQGLLRQACSLLGGGLRERIEVRRRSSLGGLVTRIAVASLVLAALAFASNGLIVSKGGEGVATAEVDHFVCESTEDPPAKGARTPIDECEETGSLVAARERAGWDCRTRRQVRSGSHTATWRCTRG